MSDDMRWKVIRALFAARESRIAAKRRFYRWLYYNGDVRPEFGEEVVQLDNDARKCYQQLADYYM